MQKGIIEEFSREIKLIGQENFEKLKNSKVILFGVGGVGGYVLESLARSGIENITIVDFDTVSESNLNRQIIALQTTIGKYKVDVAKERVNNINPNCNVVAIKEKLTKENIDRFNFSCYDFVIDAIDMVTSKLLIIEKAKKENVEVISCMGTGNKLDATQLQICDISKTNYCPLAKVMRKELKNRGVYHLNVVFSTEQPKRFDEKVRKVTPASIAYVPAVAGLYISQFVINKLMEK